MQWGSPNRLHLVDDVQSANRVDRRYAERPQIGSYSTNVQLRVPNDTSDTDNNQTVVISVSPPPAPKPPPINSGGSSSGGGGGGGSADEPLLMVLLLLLAIGRMAQSRRLSRPRTDLPNS